MVFGILRDIGKLAGEVVGTVVAIPAAVVAETLSIPVAVVKAAKEAGCETYQEIREFFDDNY
jgi:adenine/guanine phosphoribosyltransferase-like PRPP-binding protein